MAKPYDDDTDFTCVRRVVWKASAPLTSEFFGGGNRDGRPEFRAPFEKLVDEQRAIRQRTQCFYFNRGSVANVSVYRVGSAI